MALRVDAYPSKFAGLGAFVMQGLQALGEPASVDAPLSVLSPIPVSAGLGFRPRTTVAKLVRRTGWRALVMAGETPVALVDLNEKGPLSVRGADAARAMLRVLEEAGRAPGTMEVSYKLRFVVFHSLFVTALWLFSRKSLFIPTRVGNTGRPGPKVYSEAEFLQLLRRRDQKMHPHMRKLRRNLKATTARRKRVVKKALRHPRDDVA